jgi:hypothetical protein
MTVLYCGIRVVLMCPDGLSRKLPHVHSSMSLYDVISLDVTSDGSTSVLFRNSHNQALPSYVNLRKMASRASFTDTCKSLYVKLPY